MNKGRVEMTDLTELEQAEAAQADFQRTREAGHPWVPGTALTKNPGLDLYIAAALESWVHLKRAQQQSQPAKRVSLSDNPNWRPSSVAPVLPGSKEWVEPSTKE